MPNWETFDRRTKRPLPPQYDRFVQALRIVLSTKAQARKHPTKDTRRP